jgi:hypothetical protein
MQQKTAVASAQHSQQNLELRKLIERITAELNLDTDRIDFDLLTSYISMRMNENYTKKQLG